MGGWGCVFGVYYLRVGPKGLALVWFLMKKSKKIELWQFIYFILFFFLLGIDEHILVLDDYMFFSIWFDFLMFFCCFLILLIWVVIQVYTGAWLRHYMSLKERMVTPEADRLGQVSVSNASRRRLSGSGI